MAGHGRSGLIAKSGRTRRRVSTVVPGGGALPARLGTQSGFGPSHRSAEVGSGPSVARARLLRHRGRRTTTPARSSTFRCFEIVGFETPKPRVATPTVAGPRARRSTIPRRIGWATALNGSLAIWVTILAPDRYGTSNP